VRELLRQQAFQQTFWENLGTNSSSKATTRNTRVAAGLKLVNRYLDAIAAGGGNMVSNRPQRSKINRSVKSAPEGFNV
jgi:hypothetical protein